MKRLRRWISQYPELVGLCLFVLFVYPIVRSHAAQTYVRPTTGTDHPTEHLTNIDNRDEALRSNFSGTAAPTSPTPVEGQSFYETDTDLWWIYWNGTNWYQVVLAQLANTFAANQTISHATSPSLTMTDTTNTVSSRIIATDTDGQAGTTTNHSFSVVTNNNGRTTWDTSGNQTTAGGELRTTNGDDHTATAACASGYTRVGVWCYDTDGFLTVIRSSGAHEASFTTTVVGSGYKAAIIRTKAFIEQNAGAGAEEVEACTKPGDASAPTCTGHQDASANAAAYSASSAGADVNTEIVRLDSSGQVKTRCVLVGTSVSSLACSWVLVAYLD